KIDALCDALRAADTDAAVLHIFAEYETLTDHIASAATLASIRHTCDTRDAFYDAENDFFDEVSPRINDRENKFAALLLESPHRKALEDRYGALLFQKLELSIKSSCAAIIPLMQAENALVSRYEKLYASAQIPFDGKLLTIPQLSPYKQSCDRTVRRAAMVAEGDWFDAHRAEFDTLYSDLVANRTAQANEMGYATYTPLGYLRMGRCGYGASEVSAYRAAVATELVPIVAELKKLQAHRIGLEHLTYFDDAFRFSSGNAVPHGTPEEILAAGREMYHQLAPETAKFIDFMMDSELFDVLSREGKAPGGYCTYLADSKAPFIFSNFNATADDVDVLTHEAGHAFASYLASFQDLPAENREPGMESCEIHSMSMEFLTSDYHHLFFGEDTAKYQLAHAEEALSFLPYGCMVDEFQHIVYDHPALSAEERNAAWAD
ncbi:MAG: M3 family oligoendopeptidase, partial [Pygmaiobacter sp.]